MKPCKACLISTMNGCSRKKLIHIVKQAISAGWERITLHDLALTHTDTTIRFFMNIYSHVHDLSAIISLVNHLWPPFNVSDYYAPESYSEDHVLLMHHRN